MVETTAGPRWWIRTGWVLHALLRFVLIMAMQGYVWSKLNLTQMGRMDYSEALVATGEKSPMGLLWTFMAYSPVVQFLAGAAELVVVLLLVFRRTAWLGGLLGTVALGTVFLLNMTYDVPVKQFALALTAGFALVAAPELPRVARFLAGRPTAGTRGAPPLLPWPRLRRVTRWLVPVLGLALIAAQGVLFQQLQPAYQRTDVALAGVYRVVEDPSPPAARLADDRRWQQVAVGRWTWAGPTLPVPGAPPTGSAPLAIRTADGELVTGTWSPVRDGLVRAELRAPRSGPEPLLTPPARTVELAWSVRPDGRVTLSGDGQRLVLESDPELRFLYDRGFSWSYGNGAAVNR
ncbi:hypothetical protein [Pseudonocardia spirodelae]|uniref:DoxX family membrane protein n=1 Tax=Pseudonocardia spirodelae TaxID=3133431 RepID=A0ABU8T6R3_9PSEU